MAKANQIKRLKKEAVMCRVIDKKMLREMMSLVGDKWSLCVIGALAATESNRARFSEIEKAIDGISQRMLSTTLRDLERTGLVTREVFPEVPPRVEYELTDLGDSLTIPIKTLVDWISSNSPLMSQNQERFDRRKAAPARV